ncbi:MAG: hypothetical protein JO281_10185 [Pseudonocardiales bacterium]|nr:hypothetical protein [Pseudonocardiales bacterium]
MNVDLGESAGKRRRPGVRFCSPKKAGLIERRWWPAAEFRHCPDKLLPGNLAELLDDLLHDRFSDKPLLLAG